MADAATRAGAAAALGGGKHGADATAAARPTIIAEAVAADGLPADAKDHPDGFYDLAPREVHPWHRPAMPSHEAIKASPHYPVVVTVNPMGGTTSFNGETDPAKPLPINGPAMEFETDMFKGRLEIHLRGLKTTRPGIFEGKKRFFQIACQGKFKREVDASALCMGQEFVKTGNIPAWLGEMVLTAASKAFSGSAKVDVYARLPYFMNPILAACQLVNVSRDEDAPRDLWQAEEDMRLFCPEGLTDKHGNPVPAAARRKWCDQPKNLEGRKLTPEFTYTLHIWQHLIDFSSYKLHIGGFVNFDLTHALNAQPLQITCKDVQSDEYVFSALVWHEKLLYDAEQPDAAAATLAERFSHMGAGLRGWLGGGKAAQQPGADKA